MIRHLSAAASIALLILLVAAAVAGAGNPHGTPPGQQDKSSNSGSSVSASASTSGSANTSSNTPSGNGNDYTNCSGSTSQGAGVKPDNTTKHDTCATAGSDQTKQYGNGKTAGQIAISNGASASTELYGPGNSQPHKVAVCTNGKTHYVDVHALKSHASTGACGVAGASAELHNSTSSSNSTSNASTANNTTSSGNAGASSSTTAPAPSLAIVKLERDVETGGTFVPGPLTVTVGDRVDYEIHVMNNGNVDLVVHVADPGCEIRGGGTLDLSGINIPVDHTLLFHCTHVMTEANAPVYTNTATANGVSASSSSVAAQPVSASAYANVNKNVLGASHTIVRHVIVKHVVKRIVVVKQVKAAAKPAPKVVKAATFTG